MKSYSMSTKHITPEIKDALTRFAAACRKHQVQQQQLLVSLQDTMAKQAQPDQLSNYITGIQKIDSYLLPSGYAEMLIAMLPERSTCIRELFQNLRKENSAVILATEQYSKRTEEYHKSFYEHVQKLIALHDELAGFVKGKNLKPESKQWVEAYFQIFRYWIQQGSKDDIPTLLDQIIAPTLYLNRTHTGSPFSHTSTEAAMECRHAAFHLSEITASFTGRVEEHGKLFRWVLRVIELIDASAVITNAGRRKTGGWLRFFQSSDKEQRRWKILLVYMLLHIKILLLHLLIRTIPHAKAVDSIANSFDANAKPPSVQIRDSIEVTPPHKDTVTKQRNNYLNLTDSTSNIYGIDISKYQGNLLEELHSLDSLHFVICKATEGNTLTDNTFSANWEWLKKNRLIRGAYHFYIYGDDPLLQARHFLKTTGAYSDAEIPLILDIEETGLSSRKKPLQPISKDTLQQHLIAWLEYLHAQTGRMPIIYTDYSFANTWLHNEAFGKYPLWLAEYSSKTKPKLPWAWKDKQARFWQKSSNYTIRSKKTDYDVFIGSIRDLLIYIARD